MNKHPSSAPEAPPPAQVFVLNRQQYLKFRQRFGPMVVLPDTTPTQAAVYLGMRMVLDALREELTHE